MNALRLAEALNPGILARALDCEKTVATHPYNPDAFDSIRKAGISYRRQLDEVATIIRPFIKQPTLYDQLSSLSDENCTCSESGYDRCLRCEASGLLNEFSPEAREILGRAKP